MTVHLGTPVLRLAASFAVMLPIASFAAESDAAGIPRRADGRPDLSGTYDTATLTPVERPSHYGERLSLTEDEAAALANHWRSNLEKDHQPSDPDREAPPAGGVGIYAPEFTGAAGKVGGYNAFFVDIGENAFQIDGEYRTSIITDPPNGRRPPLSDEGRRRRETAAAFRHENTGTAWWIDLEQGPYDDPELRPLAERCMLSRNRSGPPALPAMYNNLKTITQTDDHVVILVEQMHDARIIRLRDPERGLEAEHGPVPKWLGDSIGWWEGDTLVVETTNFLESVSDSRTTRDLKVTERFTPQNDGSLLYAFTVEDPLYSSPWSGEYPWPRTRHRLYEYACHEGNYSFEGILKGARVLEEDTR